MTLSQSDYEFLRLIDTEPTQEEIASLRALRRNASNSSDIRLLDKLLCGVAEREALVRERTQVENRLYHLKGLDTGAGQTYTTMNRGLILRRWARRISQRDCVAEDLARKQAAAHFEPIWAQEDKDRAAEIRSLTQRLGEIA